MKIGDTAPDFEAETTEGQIRFHDWIGNSWAILFSHPKDFTPVCTTELGYMAKIKPEFDRRNVKVMGLSVDSTGDHKGWAKDIEETQGQAPNYPIVGDADFKISKLYGMLPADVAGDRLAHLNGDGEALRIGGHADHEEMSGARQLCHGCAQQSDRSRSDHGDAVAWAHA